MKAVVILCVVWNIAEVLSLHIFPFKNKPVTSASLKDVPGYRIYGGQEALEGQFPFMILTLTDLGDGTLSTCSSSLVTVEWVLTAAHCIDYPGRSITIADILLIGGKANLRPYMRVRYELAFSVPIDEKKFELQERRPSEMYHHPDYDSYLLEHDVALIKTDEPFILKNIQTIAISNNKILRERNCTVLGWGLNDDNIQTFSLNYLREKLVSTTDIHCLHLDTGPFICLRPDKRKGFCGGDSGSPLICDGKVWGVASHLISDEENTTESKKCINSLEQYYAELWYELDWLDHMLNTSPTTTISKTSIIVAITAPLLLFSK